MMLTTIVRAIEMFRVENGMVLILVVEELLVKTGRHVGEKQTEISDPIRTVEV